MATIQGVYVALFGRPADPTGLAYFNSVTKNGADLSGIGDLASTQEYKDRFAGQNNTQIVNSIYQSLFGRDAEATGLNFFVDALNKGTLNVKNIAIAILDGAQGNDKTISANKVAAADLYTKALDTPTEIGSYTGNSAAAQGRAFLAGVTTTVPTAASVDTSVAAMVSAGNAGNTIAATVFTAGADTITVGAVATTGATQSSDKNDTFNATTVNTYNPAGDKIDGGFGTDTLNATINGLTGGAGGTGVVVADGLKSVENVFFNNVTAVSTVDVTNAKNLQQVWDNASAKALTVDGLTLGTTVGLKGAITEATTFNFAAATGTSDSATVAVDNATSTVGATIANIETLTISNTGTSNVGTITAAAATTVNLTGAGSLTVALADGAATTVNNTSTGTVVSDLSAATKLVAYNGSAASDDVKIDTAGLTANVTLSGGAGADSLRVTGGVASSDKTITLTGGEGSDLFYLGNGAALANVNSVATAADLVKSLITISDFTKAADSITFALGGNTKVDLTVGQAGQVSAQADLLAAANKAVEFVGATKATVFAYGGDTYIVNDTDASGAFSAGDALVKVTGVATADLTTSNLTFSA